MSVRSILRLGGVWGAHGVHKDVGVDGAIVCGTERARARASERASERARERELEKSWVLLDGVGGWVSGVGGWVSGVGGWVSTWCSVALFYSLIGGRGIACGVRRDCLQMQSRHEGRVCA